MAVNLLQFHSKVFNFLSERRKRDSTLRYTYRRSNYGSRLENGYWFYGNENYFCISFWSGMDWKNRTPNICFIYTISGVARLEINVSDSDRKKEFTQKYFENELGLEYDGRRFIKHYGKDEDAGLEFLENFIDAGSYAGDKERIDFILEHEGRAFFGEDENSIGFIEPQEFKKRDVKVKKYIDLIAEESSELHESIDKPSKIKAIRLQNYHGIFNTAIEDIPIENQWIFLTGENGSGKTSILKGIATVLGYRTLDKKELLANLDFHAEVKFFKSSYSRHKNNDCTKKFPLVTALSLFGPNRLVSSRDSTQINLVQSLKKDGLFKPLWDFEYRMIDIEAQFDIWRNEKKRGKEDELEKRIYFIKALLSRVVPGLYDIRFKKTAKDDFDTIYIVRKDDDSPEEEKYWQELPSGTRSIFAMVSEMLVRLYHYQKNIIDPSELKGIVIIDEIDLHLHPNAQRQLIIDLSDAFKQVQFIAATHSPIPLLGAPENSVFVKISRDSERGIFMDRLLDIEQNIGNLLPNVLYTSEVFGMQNIVSVANENPNEVFTQDSFDLAKESLRLREKLQFKSIGDNDFIDRLKSKLRN